MAALARVRRLLHNGIRPFLDMIRIDMAGPRKLSHYLCESLLVPELPGLGELNRREPTKCAVGSIVANQALDIDMLKFVAEGKY